MNIAVLSGKGGTGKTTAAVNLAVLLEANYIDCDVEEPNGFIFLKPDNIRTTKVEVNYPQIEPKNCIVCGECAKGKVLLFKKLCHSCKACGLVCTTGALSFRKRPIGIIDEGQKNGVLIGVNSCLDRDAI